MARTPVLTSSTLTPFGGGGGGFGAFSIVNKGQTAYLEFLKTKVAWDNGEVSNAQYITAYELYVSKLSGSNKVNAEQSLKETKYRLARNDLLADVEAGNASWDDLVDYDRQNLAGLNHDSQTYLDRIGLLQQTQSRALSEAAEEQHALYDAGKISTAQLRAWYVARGQDPDLSLNPDLQDQIADQVKSLDLRITSEADQHMVDLFQDGKVGVNAFMAYAKSAQARYAAGTEDRNRWTKIIDDAKAQVAERGLTYRYGLSQDYIQLQKFIHDQREMMSRAGGGVSTSTSSRIVLGADGQWKTVTSTSSRPYKPSASEVAAMRDRRIELASAERQLAQWAQKIRASGGFISTDRMIGFYSQRQADAVKGTDEWYQLQARIDGLQQQKFQEEVLRAEGVRITFGAGSGPHVGRAGGGGGGGGGYAGGGGGGGRSSGGSGASSPSKSSKPAAGGPLQIVTGSRTVPKVGTVLSTRSSKFPSNLDGSAFLKFYSGFVSAYRNGSTTFTDFSSGKPVTYYLPEDPAARVAMIGQLDDLKINYYATRAQVYAGTPSEIVAAKEYSDAIKEKAENAYLILITEAKGGKVTPLSPKRAIVNPIEQGTKVAEQAKAYYTQQVKLAEEAWDRGDVSAAWAHLQLATRTAAETEAKVRTYLSSAEASMEAIYQGSGETAPGKVSAAFEDLADWSADFAAPKGDASKLVADLYKWVRLDSRGQPALNADGTLSLHDGAALFLSPDGKVTYQEVPSAGFAAKGGAQQVPDVPGHVRVTVNVGGTVPSQTVYAKWSVGTVGFTADGTPIQGKVVSGFLNGQRYTLVENPFSPGKWSAANQDLQVPSSFKAGAEDGTFTFTDRQSNQNYLLVFDPSKGLYNVVIPASPWGAAEKLLPLTDADVQSMLSGNGFGLDLSQISAADRWKYDLNGAYAGFTKDQYQKFTMPKPTTYANASGSPDDRDGGRAAPPVDWSQLTPDQRSMRLPRGDELGRVGFGRYAGKLIPGAGAERAPIAPASDIGRVGFGRFAGKAVPGGAESPANDEWYARQAAAESQTAIARATAIRRLAPTLDSNRSAVLPLASRTPVRKVAPAPVPTTRTTARRRTTTTKPKTTIAPLPKVTQTAYSGKITQQLTKLL